MRTELKKPRPTLNTEPPSGGEKLLRRSFRAALRAGLGNEVSGEGREGLTQTFLKSDGEGHYRSGTTSVARVLAKHRETASLKT